MAKQTELLMLPNSIAHNLIIYKSNTYNPANLWRVPCSIFINIIKYKHISVISFYIDQNRNNIIKMVLRVKPQKEAYNMVNKNFS